MGVQHLKERPLRYRTCGFSTHSLQGESGEEQEVRENAKGPAMLAFWWQKRRGTRSKEKVVNRFESVMAWWESRAMSLEKSERILHQGMLHAEGEFWKGCGSGFRRDDVKRSRGFQSSRTRWRLPKGQGALVVQRGDTPKIDHKPPRTCLRALLPKFETTQSEQRERTEL